MPLRPSPICLPLLALSLWVSTPAAAPIEIYTVPAAPWTFPDRPDTGVASEFIRFLFKEAGMPIKLATLPYVRAVNGLRDGSNAMAILVPDAERDQFAQILCTPTRIRSGLLYKKSRYPLLNSLTDLVGKEVGVIHGSHTLDSLANTPGILQHPVETVEQGLRMLAAERLDASFISIPGSKSMLLAAGLAAEDYAMLDVSSLPAVVYVSRKSALAQDKALMTKLKAACEGPGKVEMQRLMDKYR